MQKNPEGCTIHYLKDYSTKRTGKRPRQICFFSSAYKNQNGQVTGISVCIDIQNGDVDSVLSMAIENGGIGLERDGTFYFVPWPFAAIEIKDL